LGWQVSAGGVFSHGGSDGTQAWIDPERDLIVLALTQTPGARPDPRGRFRQAVVEACVD
jgi:CubicO group peptidase (beta-lactamase class C family)